jgi:DNA-binding transcriptional LysR family regulator
MVDIRLMQAAVAVAEELNFSRAAQRLNITQPGLSKQIAELEERLGYPLFDRSTQSVTLTDAGAAFVEHARNSLASAERAVHSSRAAAFGSEAMLNVGKTPYADPYITAAMHSVRLPLFTNLHVRLSSHYSNECMKLLRSGELDLAVVMGFQDYVGVTASKLSEEPFYVALCSSDRLCAKRELKLSDLSGRRWALLERNVNHSVYDRIQKAMSEDGAHPTEVQHILQAEEAAALILQDDSVALLPKFAAWRISDDIVTLRPLRDERLVLKTFLVARPDEQSRLVAEFVKATARRINRTPKQGRLPLAG